MNTNQVGGSRPVGAAFGGVSGGHTMAMMSPESLVALCALQLKKFDGEILSRMGEKDRNMALQEKLAGLTSKLESLDKVRGLAASDIGNKEAIINEMKEIIAMIGQDPNKQDLKNHLQAQVDTLSSSESRQNYDQLNSTFNEAQKSKATEYGEITDQAKLDQLRAAEGLVDFDTGAINEQDARFTDLDVSQKEALRARAGEHKAWLDAEKARVGEGSLAASQVTGLLDYMKSAGSSLSSRNDTIMMELQSLVSQRSTSIQMTSNLSNSLLEATKNIAANIGR